MKKSKMKERQALGLNTSQLGSLCGVYHSTVDRWRKDGAPHTSVQNGKVTYVKWNHVEVWEWLQNTASDIRKAMGTPGVAVRVGTLNRLRSMERAIQGLEKYDQDGSPMPGKTGETKPRKGLAARGWADKVINRSVDKTMEKAKPVKKEKAPRALAACAKKPALTGLVVSPSPEEIGLTITVARNGTTVTLTI